MFGTALALADLILSDGEVDSDSTAELATQLDVTILPEAEDALPDQQEWLARSAGMACLASLVSSR